MGCIHRIRQRNEVFIFDLVATDMPFVASVVTRHRGRAARRWHIRCSARCCWPLRSPAQWRRRGGLSTTTPISGYRSGCESRGRPGGRSHGRLSLADYFSQSSSFTPR